MRKGTRRQEECAFRRHVELLLLLVVCLFVGLSSSTLFPFVNVFHPAILSQRPSTSLIFYYYFYHTSTLLILTFVFVD